MSCQVDETIAQYMNRIISDRAAIDSLIERNAKLVAGIQAYLDGNYPNPRDARAHGAQEKCPHGMHYWDTCENCIDEHFTNVLKQSTEKP